MQSVVSTNARTLYSVPVTMLVMLSRSTIFFAGQPGWLHL
jgi:hypothetical protein